MIFITKPENNGTDLFVTPSIAGAPGTPAVTAKFAVYLLDNDTPINPEPDADPDAPKRFKITYAENKLIYLRLVVVAAALGAPSADVFLDARQGKTPVENDHPLPNHAKNWLFAVTEFGKPCYSPFYVFFH